MRVPRILPQPLLEGLDSLLQIGDEGLEFCDSPVSGRASRATWSGRDKCLVVRHASVIGSNGVHLYRKGRKSVQGPLLEVNISPETGERLRKSY